MQLSVWGWADIQFSACLQAEKGGFLCAGQEIVPCLSGAASLLDVQLFSLDFALVCCVYLPKKKRAGFCVRFAVDDDGALRLQYLRKRPRRMLLTQTQISTFGGKSSFPCNVPAGTVVSTKQVWMGVGRLHGKRGSQTGFGRASFFAGNPFVGNERPILPADLGTRFRIRTKAAS